MMKLLLTIFIMLAVGSGSQQTIYWSQHNEIVTPKCEWVEIRGRLFRNCTGLPAPNYYWLCEVQIFIERNVKSNHYICILIDHNEVIRAT